MISQLTVYIPNEPGKLRTVAKVLSDAGVNMHALVIADSTEFGIVRIVCDTPIKAAEALTEAGLRASVAPVIAVKVPNEPGGLAKLLEFCDQADLNIEYGYCFLTADDVAVDVLKIEAEGTEAKLTGAGFELVSAKDLYATD